MTCKATGHASWDRLFPAFLSTCKHMEATDPKHMYKFFPSQDTWMWDQEATGNDFRTAYRQTMQEQLWFEDEDRVTAAIWENPTGGFIRRVGEWVAQTVAVEN